MLSEGFWFLVLTKFCFVDKNEMLHFLLTTCVRREMINAVSISAASQACDRAVVPATLVVGAEQELAYRAGVAGMRSRVTRVTSVALSLSPD